MPEQVKAFVAALDAQDCDKLTTIIKSAPKEVAVLYLRAIIGRAENNGIALVSKILKS